MVGAVEVVGMAELLGAEAEAGAEEERKVASVTGTRGPGGTGN